MGPRVRSRLAPAASLKTFGPDREFGRVWTVALNPIARGLTRHPATRRLERAQRQRPQRRAECDGIPNQPLAEHVEQTRVPQSFRSSIVLG